MFRVIEQNFTQEDNFVIPCYGFICSETNTVFDCISKNKFVVQKIVEKLNKINLENKEIMQEVITDYITELYL